MAGTGRYTVVLDACVLYPAPLRDVLLSLADADLYRVRWSHDIEQEWVRNLMANRPDLERVKLEHTCRLMTKAFPDCLIDHYQDIASVLELPDKDDRHVLAAAIVGHADAIVTFNLRDFPVEAVMKYNIEPIHPDYFIVNQFELHETSALAAVKTMRERLRKPPVTATGLLKTLADIGLPQTAALLSEVTEHF